MRKNDMEQECSKSVIQNVILIKLIDFFGFSPKLPLVFASFHSLSVSFSISLYQSNRVQFKSGQYVY